MQDYKYSSEEILEKTKSDQYGLSLFEVEKRQEQGGYNELSEKKKRTNWRLLIDTLRDPMVVILLSVAFVQAFLGEYIESSVIF